MNVARKFGIYSRVGAHPVARAFAEGLQAIGHAARHCSHSDHRDGETGAFDVVVVFGLLGRGRRILSDYERRGTPVVVVDFGYLRRVSGEANELTGHWQVSLGALNRLPPFPCPPDRFDALGLPLAPAQERLGPAVLCLQVPGDAAHPFDTEEKLERFASLTEHDEVRRHPLAGQPPAEPLEAMLARAGKVVTWNSNVGHDALLAGIPVEALGPAPYKDVAMDERPSYFARLAYGQWTAEEMRQGLPQRFLLEHWMPGVPLAVPVPTVMEESAEEARQAAQEALSAVQAPPPPKARETLRLGGRRH